MSQPLELLIQTTTAGDAGLATGVGTSEIPLRGYLLGFRWTYHASAPATTTIVIASSLPSAYPTETLLTVAAGNTDVPYRPIHRAVYDTSNALTGTYMLIPIPGHNITVTVDLSDALTNCVNVWVLYTKD